MNVDMDMDMTMSLVLTLYFNSAGMFKLPMRLSFSGPTHFRA
jgi:hypothetical protein